MKIHIKIILPIIVILFLLIFLVGCLPGLLTPPPPKGVITGRIMVPSSETAKDTIDWIPVANATVTLTDSEGVPHTVTTDEDGYYTFTDIAVNANTIITATATIDGNTVIIKDVIPQAVAADEDYEAGTADAESTALGLIVEELLEQELDPEDINLEEIQDSDNFTEVVEQVSSILEENGNVTTDPDVTETVNNAAEEIISPPVYTPPVTPTPTPTPVTLTKIVVLPETMPLFVGDSEAIKSVIAHYSNGSTANIPLGDCDYLSDKPSIATVTITGLVEAVAEGTATITVGYGGKKDTIDVTVNPIELTGIEVSPDAMTLLEGDSQTIELVTAHYNNGEAKSIIFSDCAYESSNNSIATVNAEITAVAPGEATITVSYEEGEITKEDTVAVTVEVRYSFTDTQLVSDDAVGNLETTVTEDGDWMVWTFDFPVEEFTGGGNLSVGLIIATDGEGNGPAFQIHNNDGADSSYPWGTWLMSLWGPTIGDGWMGWHSGDTNTPVTSLSWVEAIGQRNTPWEGIVSGDGVMQIKIKISELGNAFHWAASPTVGSGFWAPAYDVTMQIPAAFNWTTPIVDISTPNYIAR